MADALPFEHLGPYRLQSRIGKGGMGSVYVARHVKTGDSVAIKIIAEHVADEKRFQRRFEREYRSLATLKHPGIVSVLGSGESGGRLFYVMQYVDGESLHARLRREKRIDWRDAIDIAIQICGALKHAHVHGFKHRDLKPANVMLAKDGTAKLVDFGIVDVWGDEEHQTAEGSILGTADYMSPEQAQGQPATDQSDLYSVGCILYAMIAGRPPFRGKSITMVLDAVVKQPPPPLDSLVPELPDALTHLVDDLLQKNAARRPPTALAVVNRLKAMRAGLKRTETQILDDNAGQIDSDVGESPVVGDDVDPSAAMPTVVSGGIGSQSTRADKNSSKSIPRQNKTSIAAGVSTAGDSVISQQPSATPDDRYHPVESLPPASMFSTDDGDSPRWQTAATAVALTAMIAVCLALVAIAFWPADASDLYRRAETGDRTAMQSFIDRYPDDPRSVRLRDRLLSGRIGGVQRRLQTQRRLGITELTPAESGFLTAIANRQTDPAAARSRLAGWLAVFDQDSASDKERDLIQLARFEHDRLRSHSAVASLDTRAIELLTKINDAVSDDDPATTTALLRGIIDTFQNEPWAKPAVEEAESQLAIIDEFTDLPTP